MSELSLILWKDENQLLFKGISMAKQERAGGKAARKYHKDGFDKISEEKRMRILEAAIDEFASKGFSSANINDIARAAEISIGSMYNYFASKEDLFFAALDKGYHIIEEVLAKADMIEGNIFDRIEQILRFTQIYSRKFRQLNQIYLDVTSEGLAHLSRKLSRKMESISAAYYKSILETAKKAKEIDRNLDTEIISFCLDNIILILQFSYTTDYFKERMKIFIGEDALKDDERVVKGIMRFIKGGLLSQGK